MVMDSNIYKILTKNVRIKVKGVYSCMNLKYTIHHVPCATLTSFRVSPGKKPLTTNTDSFSNKEVLKSLMICLLEPNP